MLSELVKDYSACPQVQAIVLGGSRAGNNNDKSSDYDLYVYLKDEFPEEERREILQKYCSNMEVGNKYWEYEDNCVFKDGVPIDIIYRKLERFVDYLEMVVEKYRAMNCYTTCFWHNLVTAEILYDPEGVYAEAKKRFDVPYPAELKGNIIRRGRKLLSGNLPSFDKQIGKAVKRDDIVSVNHRVTEFVATYFDVIFALNEKTHPGEKKLISIARKECSILPDNFEENLRIMFADMYTAPEKLASDIQRIIDELDKTLGAEGY